MASSSFSDCAGLLRGGHWASWPTRTTADYFVSCCCGCQDLYVVSGFEAHAGRKSQKKWKASTRVIKDGSEVPLGQWIIDECAARQADLPRAGERLQVYWPMDRNWYPGRVLSFTKAQGATQVEYDDGDVEMLHLVMERYRPETATDTTKAVQAVPDSIPDVIDLCSDDDIDMGLEAMQAPHRQSLPQLTAATATPLDCAYKHPRVKLDPAVALIEQASASGAGAKHHNMSFTPPAGTAKGPEQSPTGTIVRKLIQLSEVKQRHPEAAAVPTKTARSAECTSKHVKPTQAAAAGPVAIAHHAPPANQVQSARGTLQAGSSPAQQANSDKAQLPSSKTCKATTSDGSLQGVLQSRKRPSPQSLKHSGLTPLPERPAKAPCHKQRVRQHIHHNQGQHLAEQSDLSCLGSDTSQVYNRAGIPETANNAQKPVGDAQSGGSNTAAQYETQDIKLEPPTLPVASRQQVPVQHDLLPATAAQAAVVPVSSLSPQLLQRFQAGSHLNTAGKQAALEELVLAIAEAGLTARFFAKLDKHSKSEADDNVERYFRSISGLVQRTRNPHQSLVRQDKPFLAEIESHTSWRAMQRQRHDMALQVVDVLSGYLEDLCKGL